MIKKYTRNALDILSSELSDYCCPRRVLSRPQYILTFTVLYLYSRNGLTTTTVETQSYNIAFRKRNRRKNKYINIISSGLFDKNIDGYSYNPRKFKRRQKHYNTAILLSKLNRIRQCNRKPENQTSLLVYPSKTQYLLFF